MRAVVDTNILLRAVIKPAGSVSPMLVQLPRGTYTLVYTDDLLAELIDVLERPRIRRYPTVVEHGPEAVASILRFGERALVVRRIVACRDSKDDKVLEAAVAGHADVIVSGDDDLLVLSPFEGIPIVGPAAFLAMLRPEDRPYPR